MSTKQTFKKYRKYFCQRIYRTYPKVPSDTQTSEKKHVCFDFSFGKPVPTMGILEKIQEIEREIARTQKNKGKFK